MQIDEKGLKVLISGFMHQAFDSGFNFGQYDLKSNELKHQHVNAMTNEMVKTIQTYLQAAKTKPEPVFMTGKTYEPWGK